MSNEVLKKINNSKTPKQKYKIFEEEGKKLTFEARKKIFNGLGGENISAELGIPSFQKMLIDTIDPEFGPIWRRGTLDYDSLVPDEQIQFQMWCQISLIAQATNFRTGHDGAEREGGASRIEVQNQVAWRQWPGVATYYERFGRQHTYDSDLRQLLDRVFLETQGREIETTWALGVNNRDS